MGGAPGFPPVGGAGYPPPVGGAGYPPPAGFQPPPGSYPPPGGPGFSGVLVVSIIILKFVLNVPEKM